MSLKSQRLGQIGVNVVERIVLREWRGRWQPLDAQNDDGVDGLIFLEANGEATGQIIFAQVKTYNNLKRNSVGNFMVTIGTERLNKAISRWRRVVGAAIIIYVDPVSLDAYWVNARDIPDSRSQIPVPASQRFDRSARREISSLCGTLHRDLRVPMVVTEPEHFGHLVSSDYIKVAAHKLYHELDRIPVLLGSHGPRVRFRRDGWRHIIRRERPKLTRYQSLVLLGAVRPILEAIDETSISDAATAPYHGEPLFAARAAVSFPFRQTGIVKVVLRRHIDEGFPSYEFHTVYEPRRKRNVLGAREPLSQ